MGSVEGQTPGAKKKNRAEGRRLSISASRALDILEHFGDRQQPLRAKEIAQGLSLHLSSTSQLLKTMMHSGYLVFDPIKKLYSPSPRLAGFSNWLTQGG